MQLPSPTQPIYPIYRTGTYRSMTMMQILAPQHWQCAPQEDRETGCALKKQASMDMLPDASEGDTSCACTCMDSESALQKSVARTPSTSGKLARTASCLKRKSRCSTPLSVTFGNVQVREYPFGLGDNPAVSSGVPIAIQWEHMQEEKFSVDHFETYIANSGKPEPLSPQQRFKLLRNAGISVPCISAAEQDALASKSRRARTVERLHMDTFEGGLEALARGAWNVTLNRKNKKRQRNLLKHLRKSDQAQLQATLHAPSTSHCDHSGYFSKEVEA